VSYRWDFTDDGTFDRTTQVAFWRFMSPGTYPVRLVVTDDDGATGELTRTVSVGIVDPAPPGMPDMGTTPGIYVWGTDKWNITVNGAPAWTTARPYRLELRTDGSFVNLDTDATLAPLGLVPEPVDEGWRIVLEGEVGTGRITHSFQVEGATSIYMDLRLDMNGDGTPDRTPGIVKLRQFMVASPFNPVVLGAPAGHTGPFLPTVNFRLGNAFRYDRNFRIVLWSLSIETLEGP